MYNTANINHRGGGVNLNISCESFMDFCDQMMIVEESNKSVFDKFGEMEYKHRWVKLQNILLFDHDYTINVTAQAYSGKDVTAAQSKSYTLFMNNEKKYLSLIENQISSFIKKNVSDTYTDISNMVTPKTLMIKQNGDTVMLLDCVWDQEHGIGVSIIPKVSIGSQDIFL